MIKILKIKNFKLLKDNEFQLSNLNVFTGVNGMGKSTLIQTLLLLRQSFLEKTLQEKGLLLKGEAVNIGTGKDALSIDADEINNPIYFGFEDENNQKNDFYFDYLREEDKRLGTKLELTRRANTLRNNPLTKTEKDFFEASLFLYDDSFHYLNAERIAPQEFNDADSNKIERKELGKYGQFALHYLDTYKNEKIKNKDVLHPDTQPQEDYLLQQVSYWLEYITPNVKINTYYIPEINKVRGTFQIGDSAEFKPTNVGFGLTYILPVIIALLTVKENGIVIIENPESHLHPAGQSKMAELIAKCAASGRQIFIETHSDHIINGLRVAVAKKVIAKEQTKIFFFEKEINENFSVVKSIEMDNDGFILNWEKDFFDQNNLDIKTLFKLKSEKK
ncbi:MAG: DUF3696 domain-containing protein [Bacteroidetes bacterium]|nr:MAG: DUF3696 domain-containing protein [Bacteroidota bacterium]TAG87488.1 MAG: DUF3696 domain-containing protein [Bacteroidota bacterium]